MTTSASEAPRLPAAPAALPDAFLVPADLSGFWMLDPVHAPRAVTPLSQELLVGALNDGFCAGLREVGYPLGMRFQAINSWVYAAFLPHDASGSDSPDDGSEPPAWKAEKGAAIAASLPERWQREWLPAILPGLERLRTTDYGALSDEALLATFAGLRRDLFERWKIHGVLLFMYQSASAFDEFYKATFQPADPAEPFLPPRCFGGRPPRRAGCAGGPGSRAAWRRPA